MIPKEVMAELEVSENGKVKPLVNMFPRSRKGIQLGLKDP